jgi:putative glutathione S-transferase
MLLVSTRAGQREEIQVTTSQLESSSRDYEGVAARVATPPDTALYGEYSPPPEAFRTEDGVTQIVYEIEDRLSDDGRTGYLAEPDRYHLYVSLTCPWAQRALIALGERGLDRVVTWSAVDPVRDGRGWAFRSGEGFGPDSVNGFALLQEAYLATNPQYSGHISVPALWDKKTARLVSNHYETLTLDLETQFAPWAQEGVSLYPRGHRDEIDGLREEIAEELLHPIGRAHSSTTDQRALLKEGLARVLDSFDRRLGTQRFLVGNQVTDADIMLFVALVRLDDALFPIGGPHYSRVSDYPALWDYARDLYQRPSFSLATNFSQIRGAKNLKTSESLPNEANSNEPASWNTPHHRCEFV